MNVITVFLSFPRLVVFFSCYTFCKPPFFFFNATYHELIGLRPLTVSNKMRLQKKNLSRVIFKSRLSLDFLLKASHLSPSPSLHYIQDCLPIHLLPQQKGHSPSRTQTEFLLRYSRKN